MWGFTMASSIAKSLQTNIGTGGCRVALSTAAKAEAIHIKGEPAPEAKTLLCLSDQNATLKFSFCECTYHLW